MSRYPRRPSIIQIPAVPPPPLPDSPYDLPTRTAVTPYTPVNGLPPTSARWDRPQQATPWTHHLTMPPLRPMSPGHTAVWPERDDIVPPPFPTISNRSNFWEPGTFPPVPFNTPVPIRLHPHIIYNPVNVYLPKLQWDVLHHPEQARVVTGRGLIVRADLNVQGVMPAADSMWIYSDHPYWTSWTAMWGPIIIEKPNMSVRDILDGIRDYFQIPLTNADIQRVKESPNGFRNLTISAKNRINDSYELPAVAQKQGFKRVDLLGELRRFQGLRAVTYANDTWKVYMGLMPGPVPRAAWS